ncbi:MAG: S1 family peptidase [Planctomycetia bacterium]|nr:S1 family peptidase [Planctomycetia bacterium]
MLSAQKKQSSIQNTSSRKSSGIWNWLFGKRNSTGKQNYRRLKIDALEERTLLSTTTGSTLSVVNAEDILVNDQWQDIRGDVDVATNEAGDVVVTWSAADRLIDPSDPFGTTYLTDSKGNYVEDLNIYARYLTDEVQQITLPDVLAPTNGLTNGGTFELIYAPAEVQRLSFYSTTQPNTSYQAPIAGTIEIGLYVEGSLYFKSFTFNEYLTPTDNAANLQTVIRSFGGKYKTAEVSAYNALEYNITFYGHEGENLVEMSVRNCNFSSGYMAGALVSTISEPMTITSYDATTKLPVGITISSNPWTTAAAIQKAFSQIYDSGVYSPLSRLWQYNSVTKTYEFGIAQAAGDASDFKEVEVSVSPVTYINENGKVVESLTQFNITFTGASGLTDQQELMVKKARVYGSKTDIPNIKDLSSVETIKQSSPVFRVNAVEPAVFITEEYSDGTTGNKLVSTGKTDQFSPKVAMDNDGDFTIVWQSAMDDPSDPYNTYDIYARRFSVQGIVSEVKFGNAIGFYTDAGQALGTTNSTYIPAAKSDPYQAGYYSTDYKVIQAQGVRPLADAFIVNVSTNGEQCDPDIDCDLDGNFVVTWTSEAQWNSYFAGISARWFDKTGLAITGEVAVSSQKKSGTPEFGESYVAMNTEGFAVVIYLYGGSLYKSVYGPVESTVDAVPFVKESLIAADAYGASVDFDMNNRYVIAYTQVTENNASVSGYTDTFMVGYQITSTQGSAYSENTYITTRAVNGNNSGNSTQMKLYLGSTYLDQGRINVGMDADGDLFFAYQGFGLDTQMVLAVGTRGGITSGIALGLSTLFEKNLVYFYRKTVRELASGETKISYESKNRDLLGTEEYLLSLPGTGITDFDNPELYKDGILYKALAYANSVGRADIDVDTYIKACLVGAQVNFPDITEDQLGRLTAILEYMLSPLRGASNDILYSAFSNTGTPVSGTTSGVVNDFRDGANSRFYLAVPSTGLASGTVVIDFDLYDRGATENGRYTVSVPISLVDKTTSLNSDTFQEALRTALNAADSEFADSFIVRRVTNQELSDWSGTDYALTTSSTSSYAVYEITCVNAAHDSPYLFWIDYQSSTLKLDGADTERKSMYQYSQQIYGSFGTAQINAHVATTLAGDNVVVWTQQRGSYTGAYDDTYVNIGNSPSTQSFQIYLRSFNEANDDAGPIVTQVALPDGTRIENGTTVTSTIKNLVVSFDENLLTQVLYSSSYGKLHSVDNLSNWVLLCDGIEVSSAIESIVFGMSASRDLAAESSNANVSEGLLAIGSNKWEAVITFKDGSELTTGNYTLIAKSAIQDIAHNALYSQGENYAGADYEINFSIISMNEPLAFDTVDDPFYAPSVPEKKVSDSTSVDAPAGLVDDGLNEANNQITREDILSEDVTSTYDNPNTANAVSCDANGNFVAVWESEGEGIFYRAYRQRYAFDADNNRLVVEETISSGLVIGSDTRSVDEGGITSQQASVALDDRGVFVVVWDQYSDLTGSREVYAARYSIQGNLLDTNGVFGAIRVNIETDYDQQNASVAMDSDGDFVIVWESFGQDYDKQNTWGIYGRRFTPDGNSFGTSNTQQTITFGGSILADTYYYQMVYTYIGIDANGDEVQETITIPSSTSYIDYYVETSRNVEAVQNALNAMVYPQGQTYPDGKKAGDRVFADGDLLITQVGTNQVLIEFTGNFANQPVELLQASTYILNAKTGKYEETSAVSINIASTSEGSDGTEFLINETVENHQRFPSLAMDSDGNFVVSWTAWGQGADNNYETNIYAKKFVSNHYLRSSSANDPVVIGSSVYPYSSASEYIISGDSAENHIVDPGTGYDGVCRIEAGKTMGTGTLLSTGSHILTAAHVVWDDAKNAVLDPSQFVVTFETPNGVYSYEVQSVYVYPTYSGDTFTQTDLAILQLSTSVVSSIQGYDIYRDSNEIGTTFTKVGYGYYGTGADSEEELSNRESGVKHFGYNTYDITGSTLGTIYSAGQLVYDFDDGTNTNDYIGNNYGVRHTGLGLTLEAAAAQGDSGGPSFLNGKIAGVTSWGGNTSDYGPLFGGYGVDVRVSTYADWVDSILVGGIGGEFLVNEGYEEGYQIWSDVALDSNENIIITWTGYNQDNHGDSLTGQTSKGLGGIFARRFYYNSTEMTYEAAPVFLVNDFTEKDQIHSKVDCSQDGDFVIVWESYKDRETLASDISDSFGVYAKRYLNTTDYYNALLELNGGTANGFPIIPTGTKNITVKGKGIVGAYGQYGDEFRINETQADDQVGIAVAVNNNGDMVFVWTDESTIEVVKATGEQIQGSTVKYRSITLAEDNSPPYVTQVNAIYTVITDDEAARLETATTYAVSLFNNNVTFAADASPYEIRYTFSEIMLSKIMKDALKEIDRANYPNTAEGERAYHDAIIAALNETANSPESSEKKSIVNTNNWTLLKNGDTCFTSLVKELEYAYDDVSGNYVLRVIFKAPLTTGSYILTLSDMAADLFGNRLDGDYDNISGGSFTVRFNVAAGVTPTDPDDPEDDPGNEEGDDGKTFSNLTAGHDYSDVYAYYSETRKSNVFLVVANQEYIIDYDTDVIAAFPGYEVVKTTIDGTVVKKAKISTICFRMYTEGADGTLDPAGSDVVLSSATIFGQSKPAVVANAYDTYVVAWDGIGATSASGIFSKAYINGVWTNEFRVSEGDGKCSDVKIAMCGQYVLITWLESSYDSVTPGTKLMGRWYTLSSNSLEASGSPFILVDEGKQSVKTFDIASDGNGTVVVTWEAYNTVNYNTDIFAKVITRASTGGFSTSVGRYLVNDIVDNTQYQPNVSMDANGNYYIVWTSRLSGASTISARAYSINGTSRSFLGTTREVTLSAAPAYTQETPAVSVSPDGSNIVVTWASYNAEGVNFDGFNNLTDFGIVARVFNGSGQCVNYQTGRVIANNSSPVVVNKIINGDQVRPAVAAYNATNAGLRQFVVTWTSPNLVYKDGIEDTDADLDDLYGSEIKGKDGELYDFLPGFNEVYFKYYPLSKMSSSNIVVTDSISYSLTNTRFTISGTTTSGANGFYRPVASEAIVISAPETDPEPVITVTVLKLSGSDFVFHAGTSNSDWYVAVDGKKINVADSITSIVFTQTSSTGTIDLAGTSGSETVKFDAVNKRIIFSGNTEGFDPFQVTVYNAGSVKIDTAEGSDSVDAVFTAAADSADISDLFFSLVSMSGMSAAIENAENIFLRTASSQNAVVLRGSNDEDRFTVGNGYAFVAGENFDHQIVGSATVQVIAGQKSDTIVFNDVVSMYQTANVAVASTDSSTIVATGFQALTSNAAANGYVTVVGSKGNDIFSGAAAASSFRYSNGTTSRFNGFSKVTVNGNGGNDQAYLYVSSTLRNVFTGHENTSSLLSGDCEIVLNKFAYTLVNGKGSSKDSATLYDTNYNDIVNAEEDSVTLTSGNKELYTILAFEQVTLKKEKYRNSSLFQQEETLDYIFSSGEWDNAEI